MTRIQRQYMIIAGFYSLLIVAAALAIGLAIRVMGEGDVLIGLIYAVMMLIFMYYWAIRPLVRMRREYLADVAANEEQAERWRKIQAMGSPRRR